MCGLCTHVRRVFASNTQPRGRLPAQASPGAQGVRRGRARSPASAHTATWLPLVSEMGPPVIQVEVLSARVFCKNKIHLQKGGFSRTPLPAVRSPPRPSGLPLPRPAFPKGTLSSRDRSVHAACMLQSPVSYAVQ